MTQKHFYTLLFLIIWTLAPLSGDSTQSFTSAANAQETQTSEKIISKEDQFYNAGKGVVLILVIAGWVGAVTLFGKYYKRKTLNKME